MQDIEASEMRTASWRINSVLDIQRMPNAHQVPQTFLAILTNH